MNPKEKQSIYETWAPPDSPWSTWAKPVLFASMDAEPAQAFAPAPWSADWLPQMPEPLAIVLDLPGNQGVSVGLALAVLGWRPVPLYNAVPVPAAEAPAEAALVNVGPIVAALWHGAAVLRGLSLPNTAPPVFLLDADRRGRRAPDEGDFDNRSISFPTDFPSARMLLSQGIRRALLVQTLVGIPQPDLAHTLLRWQEGGVALQLKRLDDAEPPAPLVVPRPSRFGAIWYRVLASLGMQTNQLGGYGGWLEEGGSGG